MIINTKNFGEIEIKETDKITFDEGIPGFEDKKEFALINNYDTEDPVPFMWLQSTEDPELTFVVAIPFFLRPDYEVEIPDDDCKALGITSPQEIGIYTICKIEDKVEDMTFNLASPVVINASNKTAKQVILTNTTYKIDERFKK